MPLFTFKCLSCGKVLEKFVKNAEKEVEITCECGEKNFERVYDFAAKGKIWRDAKTHMEEVINPEIDRIQDQISKGKDNVFLDIAGD